MKIVFAVLTILVGQFSVADDRCQPAPLNILLTNDDGVTTVGILEMHRALIAAGHNVKRIAPNTNYSGTSGSLTLRGVTVEDLSSDEFPSVYAVSGSPATSVILGATVIFQPNEPLDLIVSGINDGPNIGPAPTASGTVGAVLTGLNMLHPAVPGIAISTRPIVEDESSGEYRGHFANVASFVSRVVSVIGCDDPSLLNTNQALHINYPPVEPAAVKGVRRAEQGKRHRRLAYISDEDGVFSIRRTTELDSSPTEFDDAMLFEEGYITVVPIDGEYTAVPVFEIDQILAVRP